MIVVITIEIKIAVIIIMIKENIFIMAFHLHHVTAAETVHNSGRNWQKIIVNVLKETNDSYQQHVDFQALSLPEQYWSRSEIHIKTIFLWITRNLHLYKFNLSLYLTHVLALVWTFNIPERQRFWFKISFLFKITDFHHQHYTNLIWRFQTLWPSWLTPMRGFRVITLFCTVRIADLHGDDNDDHDHW